MRIRNRGACLFIFALTLLLAGLIAPANLFAGLSDAEKTAIGTEATTIYRAARGVIAKNQALINDASKGDKGLRACEKIPSPS